MTSCPVDGEVDHNLCDAAGTGVIVDASSSGNTITRNIVTGASVQGGIAQGSTLTGERNVASDSVLWDDDPTVSQVQGGELQVTGILAVDPGYTRRRRPGHRLRPARSQPDTGRTRSSPEAAHRLGWTAMAALVLRSWVPEGAWVAVLLALVFANLEVG